MKAAVKKLLILALLVGAFIFLFYYFRLSDYFTLQKLQDNHKYLKDFVTRHYILSVIIYIGFYSITLACGLPVVMPLALIGGFLYGVVFGLLYAGASCLVGSIVSFLILRYIVAHWIRGWHNERIEKFNAQVQKYGYSYLLILHFLSVIPLFVINLLAAVAKVKLITVMWVTIIGTLPLNLLCVIAGQQLSTIHSFKDIFSPTIIILLFILALVAIAPLIFKKLRGSFGI
jgi:uncharacterized membrane protein YdjX (TVP38/TMEM64 family)